MLKKYCNHTGCGCLIDYNEKYCNKHKTTAAVSRKEYDSRIRDKDSKKFLNAAAWRNMRKQILIRDHGMDIYIYMTEGRVVKATHVHHIIERSEDMSLALEPRNLISLSNETHSAISRLYKNEIQRKKTQQQLQKLLGKYLEGRGDQKNFW